MGTALGAPRHTVWHLSAGVAGRFPPGLRFSLSAFSCRTDPGEGGRSRFSRQLLRRGPVRRLCLLPEGVGRQAASPSPRRSWESLLPRGRRSAGPRMPHVLRPCWVSSSSGLSLSGPSLSWGEARGQTGFGEGDHCHGCGQIWFSVSLPLCAGPPFTLH